MQIKNIFKVKESDSDFNFCVYSDTDSVGADSIINVDGINLITVDEAFNEFKSESHIIDLNDREFTFPKCKLPYYDEISHDIKLGKVEYIERHLIKKPRFKIKTRMGYEIIVTGDHSLMVVKDGKLTKMKVFDVKIGDKLISLQK